MDMEFSRDIETFKSRGFKGISWNALLFGGLTVLTASAVIGFCTYCLHLPVLVGVYICVPFAFPIVQLGFSKKNGYTKMEILQRKRMTSGYCKKKLHYSSTEKNLERREDYEKAKSGRKTKNTAG